MLSIIYRFLKENKAYAHCDIPCGIYDPHQAQLAAHTIIRMTQFLQDFKIEDSVQASHEISRITHVKEEHSKILEEELYTLRDDYFKEEHFKQYPNLTELFDKSLKSITKARQNIDMDSAEKTLTYVQEIAEIFFKTKGVEPVRVKTVYPTGGEIVLHK